MTQNTSKIPGGQLEQALLLALWQSGEQEMSTRELFASVGQARGIVYTTVAKVLDRMYAKGMVARSRQGRAYYYRPLVEQGHTQRRLMRQALRGIIGEDPSPAVAALVGAIEDISPELLDALSEELAAKKRNK